MDVLRRLFAAIGKGRHAKTQPQEVKVLYLCDLKQCDKCSFPMCKHTTDIKHAANFMRCEFNGNIYIEE